MNNSSCYNIFIWGKQGEKHEASSLQNLCFLGGVVVPLMVDFPY